MSVQELRDYLHISNAKAYGLVKLRNFPSFKIGNKYLINKPKFIEWLAKQEVMNK